MKLEAKYLVTADVRLLTGLHIGTSKDEVEIGGLDNPVIKTPSGEPYIPGSSLKGKMRMLMEFYRGLVRSNGEVHSCANGECVVCELFGRAIDRRSDNENVFNRSRLIVRDAFLDKESLRAFKDFLETEWTEIKYENSINRINSKANPRQQERVPAGACFKAEFVVNVFSNDGDTYLKELFVAMKLLEDDYLGGSGSRGYGKIKFENITVKKREASYYEGNGSETLLVQNAQSLKEVMEKLHVVVQK
uniref:CRISPR system Cms endoribonuclease Csm3 n=1 Tax=Pseudothermotoga hypogea TaxID=57487 RepID=A0A832I7D0_9THEM